MIILIAQNNISLFTNIYDIILVLVVYGYYLKSFSVTFLKANSKGNTEIKR